MKLYVFTSEPYSVNGGPAGPVSYVVADGKTNTVVFVTHDREAANEIVRRVNGWETLNEELASARRDVTLLGAELCSRDQYIRALRQLPPT